MTAGMASGWFRRARGDLVASALLLVCGLAVLFAMRDQRLPLDGCAYTAAASELVAGGDGEVFRWSHLMHVPALAAASRLLSADGVEEIFRLYQTLDMILGAVGLLLLHLSLIHISEPTRPY